MNWEYRYLMAQSFTEDEAEMLEDYANQMFEYVERGLKVQLHPVLILELAKQYREEGEDK